jgi:hypothetical protein
LDDHYDPILGMTDAGRALGFWSMSDLKGLAGQITASLPTRPNRIDTGGIVLAGRYATISLHPDAMTAFSGIGFTPAPSGRFLPHWQPVTTEDGVWQMTPQTGLLGKPLMTADESLARPARRLPDHDPVQYINDGFDELQVYYAINQLFDSLRPMGFTDPELASRPFHAFMYDPDISMRDNAYYTDDTINFTTYSSPSLNYARDNSTIWHELGHGVMDRLMGDLIHLSDTGGLSEGMADFVAQLVITDVTGNQPFDGSELFRIVNRTGFHLTNEVHDDGEAYGGAMKDMLDAAIARFGVRDGLTKMADLTLESMRLTRNHPSLDANGWFGHMLFADELGRKGVRGPGELKEMIIKALNGRNFNMDGSASALLTLKNGSSEVTSSGPGSRNNPIKVSLNEQKSAEFNLDISVKNSATYKFKFPVTVKVNYSGGALEGGVHWLNEEAGNLTYVLNSDSDVAKFTVGTDGKCDEVNRPDGSCVDYVYVQIWNQGENNKPQAKKRFYLRVFPEAK